MHVSCHSRLPLYILFATLVFTMSRHWNDSFTSLWISIFRIQQHNIIRLVACLAKPAIKKVTLIDAWSFIFNYIFNEKNIKYYDLNKHESFKITCKIIFLNIYSFISIYRIILYFFTWKLMFVDVRFSIATKAHSETLEYCENNWLWITTYYIILTNLLPKVTIREFERRASLIKFVVRSLHFVLDNLVTKFQTKLILMSQKKTK